MSRPVSNGTADPFKGLQLPVSAWKALEDANITSLEQLKVMGPLIETHPCVGPEIARVIKERLDRLAVKRAVRVRLVFPKRYRQN